MEQKELIKELCESIISFKEGGKISNCDGVDCVFCPFGEYNCGITQENLPFYQSLAQQWLDENLPKKKEKEEELIIWNRNNFDLEKFKNENIAIHCDTEEKAKDLLTLLSKSEATWCDGEVVKNNFTCWDYYKKDTYYSFNNDETGLVYGDIKHILGGNCKIVKWEIIEESNEPSNEEIKENEIVKNNSINKQVKVHILSGCSASGKDTILKEVVKKSNIVPIISTTSRPMREGEVEGREYYFRMYKECEKLLQDGMFIESRMYNTKNGSWLYGITKDSIDLKSNNEYIVIVDVQGRDTIVEYLLNNNVDRDNIRTYYIECSARERLLRSLSREVNSDTEQVLEMCRRLIADYEEIRKYKYTYDYVLRNETDGDLGKCIGCIVGEKNFRETC